MKKLVNFGWIGAGMVALSGCVTEVPVTENSPPPPPVVAVSPAGLSPGGVEVLRLAQAGTSEEVMLAYVQNAGAPFGLNSDQIVYLRNNGVPDSVVTAMLNRDAALQPLPPTTPPPAVVVTPPATPPPVYVSSPPPDVAYFYDNLSPYGTWVQVSGIGWCWQPHVIAASPTWRPYCDGGHWVYTDAGWYWQSDYSWGWAPFHYGRWQLHDGCGWVWVPDRVWGPSWVVWRTEGDHCGWAPLPPHANFDAHVGWTYNGVHVAVNFDFGLHPNNYTFVRYGDFNAHDLDHRRLDRPQVTQIYNQTTIINNYVVNNNTVINQGIKVDRVASETHTEIRKVQIHDAPPGAAVAARGHTSGNSDVVYRTELKAPARPTNAMVAQKIDDRHPVVAHNASVPARPLRGHGAAEPADVPHNGSVNPAVAETQPPVRTAPAVPAEVAPTARPATGQPWTRPGNSGHPTSPATVVEQPKSTGKPVAVAPAEPVPVNARPGNEHAATPQRPMTRPAPVPTVPPTAPVASHAAEPAKPASRTTTAFLPAPKPAAAAPTVPANQVAAGGATPGGHSPYYPLRMGAPVPGNSGTAAEGQNPHVYQPKSARQAAEAHALPPLNNGHVSAPAVKAPLANSPKGHDKREE